MRWRHNDSLKHISNTTLHQCFYGARGMIDEFLLEPASGRKSHKKTYLKIFLPAVFSRM
jgi:hypothetical protein